MTQDQANAILENLVSSNLGKPVEKEDPSNPDQCFDWIFAVVDALGIPRSAIRHLYAKDIYLSPNANTKDFFYIIPNSPTFTPHKWDIGVFGKSVGAAGHVCLCDGNIQGLKSFQSTDQNWNGHKYIEYIWHEYGDVNSFLGVLRPRLDVLSQPQNVTTIEGNYFVNGKYKLDYTNRDSMIVAFDTWVRLEKGLLVPKS